MKKLLTLLFSILFLTSFSINIELPTKLLKGYQIGDIATDFKLKDIDGSYVSMADFDKAKGFVIIFTCNTCPYAVANEDRIIALDKKYKTKGFPVIAINPNNPDKKKGDSFKLMQKRASKKGFTFPYLLDEGQEIFPQYGATKTPHVYLLHKENNGLIVKYIGAIDDSPRRTSSVKVKFVENAIESLLKGEEPKITNTKAIGCSIQ